MSAVPPIVHVVADDAGAERAATLHALLPRTAGGAPQLVVHCGPGAFRDATPLRHSVGATIVRVHSPVPLAGVRAAALRRALRRSGTANADGAVLLHAWSATAAAWAFPWSAGHRPLLVNVEPGDDMRQLAAWSAAGNVYFAASSAAVRQRLIEHEIAAPRAVVTPPAVNWAATEPGCRATVRARLALAESDEVVLVLPPITRHTGALLAAWASFLLEKVRPTVRIVVPGDGREAQRIHRFGQAGRHDWMLRLAPPSLSLSTLLAAADLAAYLPTTDAPVSGAACAALCGCPLVATAMPSVCEFLPDDAAWWCQPGDPEDTARQMLELLEQPKAARQRSRRAQAAATAYFDGGKTDELYRQIYANLATRRPAAV